MTSKTIYPDLRRPYIALKPKQPFSTVSTIQRGRFRLRKHNFKMKKIFAFILVLIVLLGAAACENKKSSDDIQSDIDSIVTETNDEYMTVTDLTGREVRVSRRAETLQLHRRYVKVVRSRRL